MKSRPRRGFGSRRLRGQSPRSIKRPNTTPVGVFPTGTINRKNGVGWHWQWQVFEFDEPLWPDTDSVEQRCAEERSRRAVEERDDKSDEEGDKIDGDEGLGMVKKIRHRQIQE